MKIPNAPPGSTLKVKTGEWRFERPVVDGKRCIKCKICQGFCPDGIMGKEGEVPDIDYDYCKGCGICVRECPVKCISTVREEK